MVNPNSSEIKVLMLYSLLKKRRGKDAYIGFIPKDQAGFYDKFLTFIQLQNNKQVKVKVYIFIIWQSNPHNCLFLNYLAAT